jgi:hypothetical protein
MLLKMVDVVDAWHVGLRPNGKCLLAVKWKTGEKGGRRMTVLTRRSLVAGEGQKRKGRRPPQEERG